VSKELEVLARSFEAEPVAAAHAGREIRRVRNRKCENTMWLQEPASLGQVGHWIGHVLEHIPEGDCIQSSLVDVDVVNVCTDKLDPRSLDLGSSRRWVGSKDLPASVAGDLQEVTCGAADVENAALSHLAFDSRQMPRKHSGPRGAE
jgi:hypothetical protein